MWPQLAESFELNYCEGDHLDQSPDHLTTWSPDHLITNHLTWTNHLDQSPITWTMHGGRRAHRLNNQRCNNLPAWNTFRNKLKIFFSLEVCCKGGESLDGVGGVLLPVAGVEHHHLPPERAKFAWLLILEFWYSCTDILNVWWEILVNMKIFCKKHMILRQTLQMEK